MLTFRSSFANGGCQQTDSGVDVFGRPQKQCVGEACMDGIFAGRSIDNSGPSLVNLRRHENSCFSIFSNTLLLEQDDRTDVQGKGSIFRLKEVHARNFFKVYSSRPPNNFLHGLLWENF